MGLIEKITAKPSQRDALIEGTGEMPCCLSYIVSKDSEDKDGIRVTEVSDSNDSHKASFSLHLMKEITRWREPLIAEFGKKLSGARRWTWLGIHRKLILDRTPVP